MRAPTCAAPRLGDDGAAPDEHHDRARVGGGRRADEGLVLGVERQRAPVAAPARHVLALVAMRVADHHDGHVGRARGEPGGVEVVAGVVGDVDDEPLAGRPQPVEEGDDAPRAHVARPAVARDGDRGQPAEHGQRLHPVGVEGEDGRPLVGGGGRRGRGGARGEHGLVPQQHHRPLGDLEGKGTVLARGHDGGGVAAGSVGLGRAVGEPHLLADQAPDGVVDPLGRDRALPHVPPERAEAPAERHLEVLAGGDRGARPHAEHEVAHHEPVEAPLALQHLGDEVVVVPAPLAVDLVVRGHHGGGAGVDAAAEVREVDVAQVVVVHGDVDPQAGVLHGVAGEVLHARHHVALGAPHEGGAHLAEQVGVLAERLLRPSPRRVAQQVHAHPGEQVGAERPALDADDVADPLLEVGVERGAPGHGDREGGGVAHDHATGAVAEPDAREAQAGERAGHVRGLVVVPGHLGEALHQRTVPRQQVQLLVQGHLVDEVAGAGLDGAVVERGGAPRAPVGRRQGAPHVGRLGGRGGLVVCRHQHGVRQPGRQVVAVVARCCRLPSGHGCRG